MNTICIKNKHGQVITFANAHKSHVFKKLSTIQVADTQLLQTIYTFNLNYSFIIFVQQEIPALFKLFIYHQKQKSTEEQYPGCFVERTKSSPPLLESASQ